MQMMFYHRNLEDLNIHLTHSENGDANEIVRPSSGHSGSSCSEPFLLKLHRQCFTKNDSIITQYNFHIHINIILMYGLAAAAQYNNTRLWTDAAWWKKKNCPHVADIVYWTI